MTRSGDDPFGFDSLDLDWLRSKPGGKWHKHPGLLAAWIADMDFPPPPVVTAAIQRVVDQGDLGYPVHSPGPSPTLQVFVERMRDRFGWHIERTHTRELNDVMQGVQMALHHGTEPGDGVVVFVPSYPPFLDTVHDNQRRLVPVAGHRSASSPTGWEFSLDEFADTVARERPRALLLCHPQNPTGHVWSEDELRRIAEVADEHDLLVVSDEIHSDLTFAPHVHRPFALFSPNRTVTVTAASKAFNLAALRYAVMHVGPEHLLATVKSAPDHLYGAANLFGAEAARAAWSEGDDWFTAVMAHLDLQRHRLADLLAEHLPGVVYTPPAATYLAWLDCRALGLGDDPSEEFARRGVRLSEGPNFGSEGRGHVRLNFATSGAVLEAMVTRMAGR